MRVPLHKVGQADLRLAESVVVPESDTPEGKLFRALQIVFTEMGGEQIPTPINRRRLHEAARSAVDHYFVEKLHSKAVKYPTAKKGGTAGVEE